MNEIKQWLLENEKILISKGDIRYSPSNIFTVEENLQLKNHQDIVNETKIYLKDVSLSLQLEL